MSAEPTAKAAAKKTGAKVRAKTATPSGTQNTERLMKVLLAPVISEKGTYVGEKHNQYLFRVTPDATKPDIKAAVELMFGTKERKIEVLRVQVVNIKGKEKRFGRFMGRRNNWKKAYVSLMPGQEINFASGENK